jgi:hypothetical protein
VAVWQTRGGAAVSMGAAHRSPVGSHHLRAVTFDDIRRTSDAIAWFLRLVSCSAAVVVDLWDPSRMNLLSSIKVSISPLDVIQVVASAQSWPTERGDEDEIALIVRGKSTEYQVLFTWMREVKLLHLTCAFQMSMPVSKTSDILHLLASINETLWAGHFDAWIERDTILFRDAIFLPESIMISEQQCTLMLGSAIEACERHYDAFSLACAQPSPPEA